MQQAQEFDNQSPMPGRRNTQKVKLLVDPDEYFLRTNPFIRNVEPINQLAAANSSLAKNRLVVYKRDPQKVQLHIPQPLELFPPQQRGLEFIVPAHARVGGVALYYPKSVKYVQAP